MYNSLHKHICSKKQAIGICYKLKIHVHICKFVILNKNNTINDRHIIIDIIINIPIRTIINFKMRYRNFLNKLN